MSALSDAEQLLYDLGIAAPEQIDLEAIAYTQGVSVKYRPLRGCEARIVGRDSRAIITVDDRNHPHRVRFSTAHELGHWHRHRGRSLMCRKEDIGNPRYNPVHPERVADTYAADLLMPSYLFDSRANDLGSVGAETLNRLVSEFRTSRTATAIRLVERGPEIAMLVCHGPDGRRWFNRPRYIPEKWFPMKRLDEDTFAYDLLKRSGGESGRQLMDADAWFDNDEAGNFELWEESIKISDTEVLSFLIFKDEGMLEDSGRR